MENQLNFPGQVGLASFYTGISVYILKKTREASCHRYRRVSTAVRWVCGRGSGGDGAGIPGPVFVDRFDLFGFGFVFGFGFGVLLGWLWLKVASTILVGI